MKPLQSVAMGLVVVALTARFGPVDALADPLGWLLVALGLVALPARPDLPDRTPPFRTPALRAVAVAGLVSVWLWLPVGQDWFAGQPEGVRWAVNVPQLTALGLICLCVAGLAEAGQDSGARAWWGMLLSLVVVVAVLPVLVHGAGVSALEQASYVAAGVMMLAAVVLGFSHAGRPWATPGLPRTGAGA